MHANPRVAMFLDARDRARASGDYGLERAAQADLNRLGYQDPTPERVTTPTGMETTAVRAPERAIPKPLAAKPHGREKRGRGGRPPLPRCEHGQVVGRCSKCSQS